jgi:hypothetical protein
MRRKRKKEDLDEEDALQDNNQPTVPMATSIETKKRRIEEQTHPNIEHVRFPGSS